MNITFSIIQVNCYTDQFEHNFEKVKQYLAQLPDVDRQIVVLPELWTTGFTENLEQANNINHEIITQLKQIADQKNFLISGSYIMKQNEGYYNQLMIIGPKKQVATYNKINLFPQLNEYVNFETGSSLSILEIWNIKIGMAICYDLRFPEIFRNYASQKVEICVLPAQWPQKRINHFNALLLARSIENQMILAASNVCGNINKTKLGGYSSVIDHMGVIRTKLKDQDSYSSIIIDIEELYQWRKVFPVLDKVKSQLKTPINYYHFDA